MACVIEENVEKPKVLVLSFEGYYYLCEFDPEK